jgi:hypothetical protein
MKPEPKQLEIARANLQVVRDRLSRMEHQISDVIETLLKAEYRELELDSEEAPGATHRSTVNAELADAHYKIKEVSARIMTAITEIGPGF